MLARLFVQMALWLAMTLVIQNSGNFGNLFLIRVYSRLFAAKRHTFPG